MSESKNLFEIVKLFIGSKLGSRRVPNVSQLPAQGKHPKPISTNNRKAGNGQRLGRVTLCQNKSTKIRLLSPGPVCIVKFWDPNNGGPFNPIILLKFLDSLGGDDALERISDPVVKQVLDEFWL